MVLLLDNLRLHDPSVFSAFCDILMMAGHPLIANWLRDSGEVFLKSSATEQTRLTAEIKQRTLMLEAVNDCDTLIFVKLCQEQ